MKIYLDCIPCFVRQALDSARMVTDDEDTHQQVLTEVLALSQKLDLHQSPPAIARVIHQRIRHLTQNSDPYRQIKQRHNQLSLQLYNKLSPVVSSADNAIETAVRLAIAGNIIDLGAKTSLSESSIMDTINNSLTESMSHEFLDKFKDDIDHSASILYLTDNAGEIVFDRLLIEQLPMHKITVAVKGSPVINDATMDDAVQAGLTKIVKVIDNGSDGPGTLLDTCSKDFLQCFQDSDLIISKGQGNYESLSSIQNKNIYFLLKAKCPVIASDIGCDIGQMILITNNKSKI